MDRKPGELTRPVKDIGAGLVWVKVIGLGNSASGKTCLIKHFCESKFASAYQPTVGVDYGFKIQTVQGMDLRVHLWDLSGNQEYLDVRNELYTNTDAVFLVYDVTNAASFENLEVWLREMNKYGGNASPVVCLVANKIDSKGKRVVSTSEGNKWAKAHKLSYYETSASTGDGVEAMFTDLLNAVVAKKNMGSFMKE